MKWLDAGLRFVRMPDVSSQGRGLASRVLFNACHRNTVWYAVGY
jgi:hypothetical protein